MKDIKLIMENWRGFLEEATIRPGREYYYVDVKKAPKRNIINAILQATKLESPEELENKLFCSCVLSEEQANFTFHFAPEGVSQADITTANKNNAPTESMTNSSEVHTFTRTIEPGRTKISWLQVKKEELRAELIALEKIQKQFIDAGIFPNKEDQEGETATITIKSSQSDSTVTLEGVAGIRKTDSKDCVGDFEFFDVDGNTINYTAGKENKPFLISHKAVGFERYAALKSTLDKIVSAKEIEVATEGPEGFIKNIKNAFMEELLAETPKRSTKPFWSFAEDETVMYFIYGVTTKKASCVIIGDMALTKNKENKFTLGAEKRIFIYPEIPEEEEYKPIYRCRYGSGGSKLHAGKEDLLSVNNELLNEGNPQFNLKEIKNLGWGYSLLEPPEGVEQAEILNDLFLPARLYISPFSRNDGGTELKKEQND
jgi:hypothetical protein